ncbi:MAG TPA: 1-deoxy-D-xylulose-5-phosphate reductoisomerase [Candidatus Didemnitutus sp.]|nr:1-deoxy-D-xylulose-5-phosphate reductoisomerase [Candidatus Didemnitutus sp.]
MSARPRRRVVILGATGSIGKSTLRVLRAHPDELELVGVAAHRDAAGLMAICREFRVPHAALADETAAAAADVPAGTTLHRGAESLALLACLPDADVVVVAVVGTAGLRPTLAAIAARKTIALASKEILVLAGKFVTAAANDAGVRLLPVDSEHNAVFQCLEGHRIEDVRKIYLTASGGAFRDWPAEKLATATPADALRHPNWAMGPKVTVDSATLANKGLELIEAQWLFGLRPEQCDAVIHTQSIVHCLVEFTDGAMLTHFSPPSMTFPIQHVLLYPQRTVRPADPALAVDRPLNLDFRPVDVTRFPCLRLAREAMAAGGTAPAVFNAANEVAVNRFLQEGAAFLAIPRIIEQTLNRVRSSEPNALDDVLAADAEARRVAATIP